MCKSDCQGFAQSALQWVKLLPIQFWGLPTKVLASQVLPCNFCCHEVMPYVTMRLDSQCMKK